jgi:uridine kinase
MPTAGGAIASDVIAREVIAIDGIDGSGKSMFAAALTAALASDEVPPVLLRVDDFRRPIDWSRVDKTEADLYYDEYYDLTLLDRCLRDFLAGGQGVEIPRYDTAAERLSGTQPVSFKDATVAVVEGVFVLRVATVAARGAVIYIETTADEARRRILSRDIARGRSPQEVQRRIDARYVPGQTRYRAAVDPLARAAAIIDNQNPETPRPLRLDATRFPAAVARALGGLLARDSHAYS